MKYTTPKGVVWERTNILADGQFVYTSNTGGYVVVNPNVDAAKFFGVLGYGDISDLEELVGEEI